MKAATVSGGLEGPLGASSGSGKVSLAPRGDGTVILYNYNVEISGKVAAIGGRMLEGAAKIVVAQFFERLTAQVGGSPLSSTQESWWRKLVKSLGLSN